MRLIQLFLMLFFCVPVFAATYGDADCSLVEVIDGDTIRCDIKGYPDIIGKGISVRFRDVNTPEIKGEQRPQGLISKKKLEALLAGAETVMLKDISRDKYFRIDADIYHKGRKINTNELLQP